MRGGTASPEIHVLSVKNGAGHCEGNAGVSVQPEGRIRSGVTHRSARC